MVERACFLALVLLAAACGGSPSASPSSDPTPDPGGDPPPAPVTATVTVVGGTGSGTYEAGAVVPVVAGSPAPGKAFDGWTGDTGALADPQKASTTLTVPEGGATVTATYRTVVAPQSFTASVETDPVPTGGDAADDPCIWIHPTDPSKSTIIGTDKTGGNLLVYDLDGKQIHRYDVGRVNNVDLRYNFPFDGGSVTLVTATDRTADTITCYRVDPSTRGLVHLGDIDSHLTVYGHCLYRSPVNGDTYGIVTDASGRIEQWRIEDDGNGSVAGTLVRTFDVGQICEGCVADDELGYLYISEEPVGIWQYGAEPGDGTTRTLVDGTGSNGHLTADVEGLTIYYAKNGQGYLIASCQGADEYAVYERGAGHAFVMLFRIVSGTTDGTSGTDGIDVTNLPLGPSFPNGVFVTQDGDNGSSNQNFKLVPWERIATGGDATLRMDTSLDPRDR